MKRIALIVFLLGITIGFGLSIMPNDANAGGIWGMIKNAGMETREAKMFQVEVKGVNLRAYVFDVPEMKSICINTWGDNNQQLECKTYKEIGINPTK